MKRTFRKYHRSISIIFSLPLLVTLLSGMLFPMVEEWFENPDLADTILKVHTMEIIGLDEIYPLVLGFGLAGLIATGLSMTRVFNPGPNPNARKS